jgi:hypothetical protein
MLMHDGELQFVGDPEDAAMRYYRLNFEGGSEATDARTTGEGAGASYDLNGRVVHAQLRTPDGAPADNVEQDVPIGLDIVVEAARELVRPIFVLHIVNEDGLVITGMTREHDATMAPGDRVQLAGDIENKLVPGRYSLDLWIRRDNEGGDMALQPIRLIHFVVYGTAPRHGVVALDNDISVQVVEAAS